MRRIPNYLLQIWESFWFLPALIVAVCLALAVAMIQADEAVARDLLLRWQRLFGAGADGSRAMLSAIATSIVTVASVTFSITMLALSQTSTQYSPRLLRNFLRDRTTQTALGVFLGVFAYCLVVLRTIESGDDRKFVPSMSVTIGGLLALLAVGFLVAFIHHIANALQASRILASVSTETLRRIDEVFPQQSGLPSDVPPPQCTGGLEVKCPDNGYLVSVDIRGLVRDARKASGRVVVAVQTGAFAAAGDVIARIETGASTPPALERSSQQRFQLSWHRSIRQDPAFGIQQVVDIALKALSPGVNDPTTAIMAIEYLSVILKRLAGRSLGTRAHRDAQGRVCVLSPAPSFEEFVTLCFGSIRAATDDRKVLTTLAAGLQRVAEGVATESRRRILRGVLGELSRAANRMPEPDDQRALALAIHRAAEALDFAAGQAVTFRE